MVILIAIIGAGGHAKCVYECFYLQGREIFGFYDDDKSKNGMEVINDVRVIGVSKDILENNQVKEVFIAIGDNSCRIEKYTFFKQKGYYLPNAIHKQAYCSAFVKLGKGNMVMGSAIINPASTIGNYCIINTSATVGHDCILEDGVQIGPGVNLAGGCMLGEGVFIGIGAKVAPNVKIGPWAVVGAGSVVLEDLPGYSFSCGIPACVKSEL